jgi:UDP-glucose 4-epimerase
VVDATIRAAMVRTDAGRAEFINVGMGHLISINQLFSECAAVTNYKLNPEYHPERKADVLCSFANTTKLKSFLGVSTQFSVDRFRKQLQEILNHQNEFEK